MQQIKSKNRIVIIVVSVILFILVVGGLIVINKKNNLIGSIIQSVTNTSNKTIEISIDASKVTGEMPKSFKVGYWLSLWNGQPKYITEKLFNETSSGKIQFGPPLALTTSFLDFQETLKEGFKEGSYGEFILKKTIESNEDFLIGFWPYSMPEWLSSRAGDKRAFTTAESHGVNVISPPKCYKAKCTSMDEILCYTGKCKEDALKDLNNQGYVVGWASLADFSLRFFKEKGVTKLGYYEGHEPNRDWLAKEEDFYKLYSYSAKAAKEVDPNIKVGGVGPWGWDKPKMQCSDYIDFVRDICLAEGGWANPNKASMLENFIKYSAENKLPLDFINFHSFGIQPKDFKDEIGPTIKQWLTNTKYYDPNQIAIYPADWTRWQNGYPADYTDTEQTSSYIGNALHGMDVGGISWNSYDFYVGNYILEKNIRESRKSEFLGTWSIGTDSQIIKPVFNAFKLISILYGKQENQTSNQIQTENKDDFITIITSQTQDKTKTRILLSNFVMEESMLERYLLDKFQNLPSMISTKPYREQIKTCEGDGACLKNILSTINDPVMKARVQTQVDLYTCFKPNTDKVACITDVYNKTTDQQTKTDINIINVEYEKVLQYQKESRQVALNINNLPFSGNATITTYTIDKNHSNSCRYNKKTEPILKRTNTECGINGNVDKWVVQAKTEASGKAKPVAEAHLKQQGYTNTQLSWVDTQLFQPCRNSSEELGKCILKKQTALCPLNSTNWYCTLKFKLDFTEAYKKYQEAYDGLFYYGKYENQTISMWIDKINTNPNISLEGSKQTKQITITNGKYGGMITMQPNSVVLVEIGK